MEKPLSSPFCPTPFELLPGERSPQRSHEVCPVVRSSESYVYDLSQESYELVSNMFRSLRTAFPDATFELLKLSNEDETNVSGLAKDETFPDRKCGRYALACTDECGVILGKPDDDFDESRSCASIANLRDDPRFCIGVDDKIYDTRDGMTLEVYKQIAQFRIDTGNSLPNQTPDHNHRNWTKTLLSGYCSKDGFYAAAGTCNNKIITSWVEGRHSDLRIYFRPAVILSLTC